MGYYTRFELYVVDSETAFPVYLHKMDADTQKINSSIEEATYYRPFWDSDRPILFDGERLKWYDYAEDMATISLNFPQYIFRLEGVGEENGDQWAHWFFMGRDYKETAPKWRPSPLDFSKLK